MNDFVVSDLTLDCNWSDLANSAAAGSPVRDFTAAEDVSNSAIIHSVNGKFTELDVGRCIIGAGIPPNAWIGKIDGPETVEVSSSAISNEPALVAVKKGSTVKISEKNCKVTASYLYGASNCKFQNIRAIHGYGSLANQQECFAIGFASSGLSDATGNVISHCIVENWFGNYANPFALAGFRGSPSFPGVVRWMANSRVEYCTAIGRPGIIGYPQPGSTTPFSSGGVNLADVKDCVITHNQFLDCQSIAYQDTGGFENVEISDNTLVNGFQGIVFRIDPSSFPGAVFRHPKIMRNRIGIQRRYTHGANYGIIIANDCDPIIENNTITYDRKGPGGDVFWPITIAGKGGTIVNNIIDGAEYVRVGDGGTANGAPD